jgi:hypothetical protein
MFGITTMSFAGVFLLVIASNCHAWGQDESAKTKEFAETNEMEPWDQDQHAKISSNFEELETQVKNMLGLLLRCFTFSTIKYLDHLDSLEAIHLFYIEFQLRHQKDVIL